MRLMTLVLGLAALFVPSVLAQEGPRDKPPTTDVAAIAETLARSIVRVEYTLQYDKSQAPYGGGWEARCPSCGEVHGRNHEQFISEERPAEAAGFVLSPTTVVTVDPMLHSRFIKSTAVRFGGQVILATPHSFSVDGSMMILKLDEPLKDVTALAFDANLAPPHYSASYTETDGTWSIGVQPLSATIIASDDARRFIAVPAGELIVDSKGRAVGISRNDTLGIDGRWKGSPSQWPALTTSERNDLLSKLEATCNQSLPTVHLMFRSPKASNMPRYSYDRDDAASMTEWHGTGVMVNPTTLLVLANLKPDVTARLERIRVNFGGENTANATFQSTLKDYGAFIATLDSPANGAVTLASGDVRSFRNEMLLSAEIQVQGESRTAYYSHTRISAFNVGWGRNIYPTTTYSGDGSQFLFSRTGQLVAVPLERRQKVTVESEWRSEDVYLPSELLSGILANLKGNIDPSNVPLSEDEENRIAWLGIEMQELDEELARINKVSEHTRDGEIGGLVTWVYEGSPAATAGIEVGDILLRLHVESHPKPLDIEEPESSMYGAGGFPWDRLDELPESYYDRIPAPWPSVDNRLNRRLTQLGFGTPVSAEFVRDGTIMRSDFTIVESPSHHSSSPKYKNDDLGLTVRNLTYEVQRYIQRKPDEPGVIIARLEPGSRASVAGIKPYEVITHVNDAEVRNVGEFEQAVKGSGTDELRLSIRRMTRGRIVKIKMDGPPPEPVQEDDALGEEE